MRYLSTRLLFRLCLSGAMAVLLCGPLHGDEMEEVARNYSDTIDRIISVHAVIHIGGDAFGKRTSEIDVEYWQDRGKVRIKQTMQEQLAAEKSTPARYRKHFSRVQVLSLDRHVTEATEKGYEDTKERIRQAHIGDMTLAHAGAFSIWSRCGFLLSDEPEIWLKEALQSKGWRCTASQEVIGGQGLVRVEGRASALDRPSFLAWLDPERGHMMKKLIVFDYAGAFEPAKPHNEFEVIRFHPAYKDTGVAFPAKVVMRFFMDKRKIEANRTPDFGGEAQIRSIQINEPIAESIFRLTIPAGYLVIDRTKGQHYTMGADGKPQEAAPLVNFVPAPPPALPQQRSFTWLLLVLAVLAAAGLGYAWNCRRRRLLADAGGPG